jgi:N6-L-threonylcarbamoyladenine synthase
MAKLILGIETSCDETSAAVVADGRHLLSNIVASQIDIHQKYGGVVPEIASRKHIEAIIPVIEEALSTAGAALSDLSAIAVTRGPGLVGALLVGVAAAKSIAYAKRIPLLGINHIESHIYANFLDDPDIPFPVVCLIVSGGHTDLVYIPEHGEYELMGRTRDDAAGEAFDKVARALGLGYPGGPIIDQLASRGNPKAVKLPRAYLESGSYDFSFSGLKTAVMQATKRANITGVDISMEDMAASFQTAVVEVLVDKTMAAAKGKKAASIIIAGGVAANSELRTSLEKAALAAGFCYHKPPMELCTDNAAMVACLGYYQWTMKRFAGLDLNAVPSLPLGQR